MAGDGRLSNLSLIDVRRVLHTFWVLEFTTIVIAFDDGNALTELIGISDDCRDTWQRLLRIQGTYTRYAKQSQNDLSDL